MPIDKLNLPLTHEDARDLLNPDNATYHQKIAQFVHPVEQAEEEIISIKSRMGHGSGRVVLILGETGSGKSTFIESFAWRKHLGFAYSDSVDCSSLNPANLLGDLLALLQAMCNAAKSRTGTTVISIDYLESLRSISSNEQR